jgi:type I restriction enzyme S subunit
MNNKLENIIKTLVYLKDISTIIMGQSPKSIYYNDKGQGKFLIQGNADIKNRITIPRSYSSEGTKTCNDGDIIMSVRAPVGSVAKANGHYFIGRGVCAIRSDINEYIYQYLLWHESMWEQFSTGSTFDSITSDIIRNLNIPLHNKSLIDEYSKLLSTMDKLIEDKEKLINHLIVNKKATYLKLISRHKMENSTKLSDLTTYKASTLNMNDILENGQYSVYGANAVVGLTNTYISEKSYISIVKDGAGVGRVLLCDKKTNILGTMGCINVDDNTDINFIYNFMKNINWKRYIIGSTIPHVYYSDFKNIRLPKIDIEQQKKIGNLLSSMDKIIDLHKQELEQLKLKKKYYLNKIFN